MTLGHCFLNLLGVLFNQFDKIVEIPGCTLTQRIFWNLAAEVLTLMCRCSPTLIIHTEVIFGVLEQRIVNFFVFFIAVIAKLANTDHLTTDSAALTQVPENLMTIITFFHLTTAIITKTDVVGLREVIWRRTPIALNLLMMATTVATATPGQGATHFLFLLSTTVLELFVIISIFVLIFKLISVWAHLSVDTGSIANTSLPTLTLTQSRPLSHSGCSNSLSDLTRLELVNDLHEFKLLHHHLQSLGAV